MCTTDPNLPELIELLMNESFRMAAACIQGPIAGNIHHSLHETMKHPLADGGVLLKYWNDYYTPKIWRSPIPKRGQEIELKLPFKVLTYISELKK